MTGRLQGKRVLVVEDANFIASDRKRQLTPEGAKVVGSVGRRAVGLSRAEEPLDAALPDMSLAGPPSCPIAAKPGPGQ